MSGGAVPRQYTLGKRGEAKAETRQRIVDAALRLYREVGVAGATVPAIAAAADVAPATVRNHFPTAAELGEATAEAVIEQLRMPDAGIFAGTTTLSDRIGRLIDELVAFFERGTGWWEVREADRVAGDTWAAPEVRYYAAMGRLIEVAIAPLDDDPAIVAVTGAVLNQAYFSARAAGRSAEEAGGLVRSLLVPWLESRRAARAVRTGGRNRRSVPPSGHDGAG
jgi:AcrR family transcriptional regulator